MRKFITLIAALSVTACAQAQVTGGQHAFEYLNLSNSPHVSALGGMVVANPDNDVNFIAQNPALLVPSMHTSLGLNYNIYYAGIGVMNMQYAHRVEDWKTNLGFGVQYLNYGTFKQTDAAGLDYGDFRANDFAINFTASRQYLERWNYGASLKLANSKYFDKSSLGIFADAGITYTDTANLLTIGLVAKNVGVQVKQYTPGVYEPMPFDLRIGITKKFKHLPFRLMVVAHHLYEWDIRYNNPDDQKQNLLITDSSQNKNKSYFADKLFRHFIFGGEILLGKYLEISVAYNHMQRGELGLDEKKGMAGFSFGAALVLPKMRIHYGRSQYSVAGAYNEFGINFNLNRWFGMGGFGDKVGWNNSYAPAM